MLSTNDKGNLAELAIALAAARPGVPVLKPVREHERFDLVFEVGRQHLRVQRKWGSLSPDGDTLLVRVASSRRSAAGQLVRAYNQDEIDLVAVYAGHLDRSYLLAISLVAGRSTIWLRLTPP